MANDDWDITKPIDHTKIGDVPGAVRDVTSAAKIIIAKEHETPGTDNAGGQHLMGAVRVSLQSGLPALDPEGNSLDTTATTDDGRLSIDTAESNEARVYVATAAGVSTGWQNIRVARVKASEDLDANAYTLKNLASGTQAGEAIQLGQVDTTPLTGQLKLLTPTTDAKVAVAVLDPPTANGHIGSKKYIDAQITAHAGCEASGATVFNTTLTAAATFQDLDVSAQVGSNIAFCFFEVTVDAGTGNYYVMKPKGEGSATTTNHSATDGCGDLNLTNGFFGYVACMTDASGIVQHAFQNNSGTVTVKLIGFIK